MSLNSDFHKIIQFKTTIKQLSIFSRLSINQWDLHRLPIMNARWVKHAILQPSRFLSR